ncbi:extracellular exo-polygalacturonase [Phlyctema vagabunda]|uniref:Extracellular exo-polygalacturonase n=1 Tax=Phlyctema vagabunda TaxID=108571 RepID=A0ABR4PH81_9HELO
MRPTNPIPALALSLLAVLVTATAAASPPAPPASPVKRARPDGVAKRATCTPASAGVSSIDDVPAISAAMASCGDGGTIEIVAGKTYMIRTPLDFSGCTGCTLNVEGTLKVSDDLAYWEGRRAVFYLAGVQGATIQSRTGAGLIDGNGQAAYDYFATNTSYRRPTLHYITSGSSGVTVQKLRVKNAPNVFFSVTGGSAGVAYRDLVLSATSKSSAAPKNTDGFNIGNATRTTLSNITVANQDDCIAFKPGADGVTVTGITCTGSHGLSVGSLGGGAGAVDVVRNVYVSAATMINSTKAVGIKLYPGGSAHGTASVSNVTWDGVTVVNCDYAAQIQSCYGEDAAYCTSSPSTAAVSGVYFKNFQGTTSAKYAPTVANLNCPPEGSCDVHFSSWSVKPPSGTPTFLCANVDSETGLTCTSGASG